MENTIKKVAPKQNFFEMLEKIQPDIAYDCSQKIAEINRAIAEFGGEGKLTLEIGIKQSAKFSEAARIISCRVNVVTPKKAYDLAFECLRTKFLDKRPLWNLSSAKRWGSQPAGEKQLEYIQRLSSRRKIDVSNVLQGLTKLQATSLIERLKG